MSDDKRKDLRLIKPDERVEPSALAQATDALRAALGAGDLDEVDHEAILALTLGDDVFEASAAEHAEAEALAQALSGRGSHPLAELCAALRAAHGGGELAGEDHEALIALTVDTAAGVRHPDRSEAERLAQALEGAGDHPLAELAASLRAAERGRALPPIDAELLLSLATGTHPELEEAERRRADALARGLATAPILGSAAHPLADLAASLRAAERGGELSPSDGEVLLSLATGAAAELSQAEREDAAALERALAGEGSHPLAELAASLRAASGSASLGELHNERVLRSALERAARALRLGRSAFIGAVVALAAGFALFVGSMGWLETVGGTGRLARHNVRDALQLIDSRSTLKLFDPAEPFPVKGGESERMEKIVASRAADLRANRFSAWGVR
jgi:hypothetical protein